MKLLSVAEFAKSHGAKKQAAAVWKAKECLVFRNGKVDVDASDERMRRAGLGRYGRRAGQSSNASLPTSRQSSKEALQSSADRRRQSVEKPKSSGGFDFRSAQEFVDRILQGEFLDEGDAGAVKENGLALKHMLDALQTSGELISFAMAEQIFFDTCRSQRDVWLNFPTKVGPMMAAELDIEADRLIETLTKYVHQQCADLGEPDVDFSEGNRNGK